jgi:hypothetical protein
VWPIVVGTAVIWAPLLCLWVAKDWWLEYVRKLKIAEAKFSMIEIKIPKEVFKSPEAFEMILNSLYGDTKPPLFTKGIDTKWSTLITDFGKWWDALWLGKWPLWWSLEIASIEGNIYFFIRCEPKNREGIENLLYAQFPQAEITEVDDYTKYVPPFKMGNGWDLRGCEYRLKETFEVEKDGKKDKFFIDALPLKTYVDYGLDKAFNLEENQKIDPLVPLLQVLGSLGQGEQAWIQYVMQGSWAHFDNPNPDKKKEKPFVTWQDVGKYWIDEIILKKYRKVLIQKEVEDKETGEKTDKSTYSTGIADAPEREKPRLEATERKLVKYGYDTGIRVVYLGKGEKFKKDKFGEIKNAFKQFAAPNRNSLEAINGTDDGFDYPWQDYKDLKKITNREKMFKRYVKRDFFYPPEMGATVAVKEFVDKPLVNATLDKSKTSVLSTEELATLFHFPGSVAETSALGRIDAQKAEPPANLPI